MANEQKTACNNDIVSARPETIGALRVPLSFRLAAKILTRMGEGSMDWQLPNGSSLHFAGATPGTHASIAVRRLDFARPILLWGEDGFIHSYLSGAFDSPDLVALLTVMEQYAKPDNGKFSPWRIGHQLSRLAGRVQYFLQRNTKYGARRNILSHYDLGNDFYALWLDRSMTYSSAYFSSPDQSLESAQRDKYERICKALELDRNSHILEIGCGWGGFAAHAASTYGARITAITISPRQYEFARRRMIDAGLDDLVEVRLIDYRDVIGSYDAIVSIEMFEAVGESYWPVFFAGLKRMLKPGGKAALQIITVKDASFEHYRRSIDFLRRYIFPGGMLPCRSRLDELVRAAGLDIYESQMFGQSYIRTLQEWRQCFESAWPKIRPLGFDERFRRMWRMYLSYCEVGFGTARIDVGQFLLRHG